MIDTAYVTTMARYNRWQNRSLYEAADTLTDAARRQDRGAFFHSVRQGEGRHGGRDRVGDRVRLADVALDAEIGERGHRDADEHAEELAAGWGACGAGSGAASRRHGGGFGGFTGAGGMASSSRVCSFGAGGATAAATADCPLARAASLSRASVMLGLSSGSGLSNRISNAVAGPACRGGLILPLAAA